MSTDFSSPNITIIGGDYRHYLLYKNFVNRGFSVSGVSLQTTSHTDYHGESVHAESLCAVNTLLPSDVWITGIPFTKDQVHLYSENSNCLITMEYFFHNLSKHPPKLLIGGCFPKEVVEFSREYQIPCHDLLKCNAIAIENAIPTAEGAIYYAMEASQCVLHKSQCLVLGYGKCGKVLAEKLKALDAKVTVCARREEDLSAAEACGMETISYDELNATLGSFMFIFNTVPARILDKKRLSYIDKDAVIIDIASMPGGVDFETAESLGITTRHCLGIPGKLAPKTAADILAKQIITLLKSI